jgi:hypothetical protein
MECGANLVVIEDYPVAFEIDSHDGCSSADQVYADFI